MTDTIIGLIVMVFTSICTGAVSAFIAVQVMKNDISWIKKSIDNLFMRIHHLETKGQ